MINQQHKKNQQVLFKTKHFNWILVAVFALSSFYPIFNIYAALSCTVTTQASCNGSGYTTLLRMSGSTNAHSELPSQSNVNYDDDVVCCSGVSTIGNSCSASNKQIFARISGSTNGTIQETSVNTYGTNVCLSDSVDNDTITVGYQNSNCSGYDTTLASISSSDNAHVGDASAYTRKICATIVQPTITFDLDTASDFTNGESTAPYLVELGALSAGSVNNSNGSSIRMIVAEGETNAPGGMVVTVYNAGGADGLRSASIPTDKIPSTTGTMSAGTARYGLCVATSGLTGFSRATGYSSDSCSLGSGTNGVRALSSTPTDILNSGGGTLSGGHAEIVVNATISPTTPSHNDYEDTLTFIATGTF
jgi:hypothetical protein